MAELKNGHLRRERKRSIEQPKREQQQLELEPAPLRARFFAMEVEGDDATVAAAAEFAASLLGGRHG